MGKGPPVAPKVMKYLRENKGVAIHYTEIADTLNLQVASVNGALARMQASNELPVIRLSSGMYMYKPGEFTPEIKVDPIVTKLFEWVGNRKDGVVIARGDDGKLYELKEF